MTLQIINNIIIKYYNLLNLIINNQNIVFNFKFRLYYIIFLILNKSFLLFFTNKLIVKLSNKTI